MTSPGWPAQRSARSPGSPDRAYGTFAIEAIDTDVASTLQPSPPDRVADAVIVVTA